MIVGVTTEAIAGEGLIVTAGGIDAHIHFICPQQAYEAHRQRRHHLHRRRHRAGDRHQRDHLHARRAPHRADAPGDRRAAHQHRPHRQGQHLAPGGPRRSDPRRRGRPQAARGLGHHARPPSTAASASPRSEDVQVTIHTDTLNESGYVDDSIAAFKGRTIHTLPLRGRRRRPRARHPPRLRRAERPPQLDQPDAAVHGQHARRAPRHAHGLPPPRQEIPEDVPSPRAASAARPSPPRTSCTTWAPSA